MFKILRNGFVPALLCLLTAFSARGVDTYPYQPDFTTEDGWTHEDNVTGKSTRNLWQLNDDGYWNSVCWATSDNASYLFSPSLEVGPAYKYNFNFKVASIKSSYPVETFKVFILEAPTHDANRLFTYEHTLDGTTLTDEIKTSKANEPVEVSFQWIPENEGTVYFCILACSNSTYNTGGEQGKFFDFSITTEANATIPCKVSDLAVTPADNAQRSVTLSWTNPTQYTTGEDLAGHIASIKILRNDELIATITDADKLVAGAAASYVDSFEESGVYTYKVIVVDDAHDAEEAREGEEAVITTGYVGPVDPIAPPYATDFTDEVQNSLWTLLAAAESNEWSFTGKALSCDTNGKENNAYAISRPVTLDASKAYRLAYKHAITNRSNKFDYDVVYGTDKSIEGMTTVLTSFVDFSLVANNTKEPVEVLFSPVESGTAYFGFHATGSQSSSMYSSTLTIYDLTLEEIPIRPLPATELTTATEGEGVKVALGWQTSAKSETGLDLGEITAEIYRDGALLETMTMTAGNAGSFIDTQEKGLTAGFHTYYIVLKNGENASDVSESVTSSYLGGALDLPFVSDFENESSLWTAVDNSSAQTKTTFVFADGHAKLQESSSDGINDWLITPPLKLKAATTYEISMTAQTLTSSSYNQYAKFTVHTASTNAIADMGDSTGELEFVSMSVNTKTLKFTTTEAGEFCIGFYAKSNSTYHRGFDVSSIKVVEYPVLAKKVTDATAKSVGDEVKVQLTWTMPTQSIENEDLAAPLSVNIYRDSEETPFHTIDNLEPGQEVAYTDEAAQTGVNTYRLTVVTHDTATRLGGESEAQTVTSDYAGPAYQIPFNAMFTNGEDAQPWTQISVSGNASFEFDVEGHEGNAYLEGSSTTYTNWLITPPLNLEAGKTYSIKFKHRCDDARASWAPDLLVYLGTSPVAYSLTSGTQLNNGKVSNADFGEFSKEFGVSADGKYFIGIQIVSGNDSKITEISEFSIEKALTVPSAVTTASAVAEGNEVTVTFNVPSTTATGSALSGDVTVNLYRNDSDEPVATGIYEAGTTDATISDTLTESGYFGYSLTVSIEGEGTSAAKSLGTEWYGDPVALPYDADFANKSYEWDEYDDSLASVKVDVDYTVEGVTVSTASSGDMLKYYLYAPYVELVKDQGYTVTMRIKVNEESKSITLAYSPQSTTTNYTVQTFTANSTEGADYTFDFISKIDGPATLNVYLRGGSSSKASSVTIESFRIEKAKMIPLAVSALTAEEDPDVENGVKISFKMPTKTTLGTYITDDMLLTANVFRNDEETPIATREGLAAGAVVDDITDVVLSNGITRYTVITSLPDGEDYEGGDSAPAVCATPWIGAGMVVWYQDPYLNDFTDQFSTAGWTVANNSGSSSGWKWNSSGDVRVSGNDQIDTNDYWLFMIPVTFEKTMIYEVSFEDQITYGKSAELSVFLAKDNAIDAEMIQLGETLTSTTSVGQRAIKFTTDGLYVEAPDESGDDGDGSETGGDDNTDDQPVVGDYPADDEAGPSIRSARIHARSDNESPDAKYVERYIAFKATNLTAESRWDTATLKIDNFKLDCLSPESTGIGLTETDGSFAIALNGDMLVVLGMDVKSATVYTVAGSAVAHAVATDTIDIAHLPAGVYILRVDTSDGPAVIKFRK